jgi:hypothetical protein
MLLSQRDRCGLQRRVAMFEDVPGRLISGALWGLGAGLALSLIRGREGEQRRGTAGTAARPLAKSVMKGYVATADRVKQWTAEARENLEDIYAEVQAERGNGAAAEPATAGEEETAGTTTAQSSRRIRGRTTRNEAEHEG